MRVKIEKLGSYDRGVYEAELHDLDPQAQAAVTAIMANPPPTATPPGGDQPWFRLTVGGAGDERSFAIAKDDMPRILAVLAKLRL